MKVLKQVVSRARKIILSPRWFLRWAFISIFFLGVMTFGYIHQAYVNRIFEGISIDTVDVSGLTQEEARQRLESMPQQTPQTTITLYANEVSFASTGAQLKVRRDLEKSIAEAYQTGRNGSLIQNARLITQALSQGIHITSPLHIPASEAQNFLDLFLPLVEKEGKEPYVELGRSNTPGSLTVVNGEIGYIVNYQETLAKLSTADPLYSPKIEAIMQTSGQVLTEPEIEQLRQRANLFVGKTAEATFEELSFKISDQQIVRLLTFPDGYQQEKAQQLIAKWQTEVDRPAQNAELTVNEEKTKAIHFVPQRNGRTLDIDQSASHLLSKLSEYEKNAQQEKQPELVFSLAVLSTEPAIPLSKTNSLGIVQRIGFGESYYHHSIPSRVHNVSQASKIVNNVLVAPGEEFSFNKALGEVSGKTGFQPAYVIKSGSTVLGDGGGVCQVSTTLFRALLDSGLKITKRLPHSYRVSYYEINNEPGFDATVYSGEVDLRFMNDTEHYVLLHFTTYPKNLYMTVEIFGTSDGRTTEITGYQKWGQRPAPAAVYIDDPSLPAGKIVQVDWAVGGIRTKFKHIVKDKDGNILQEKEYFSNYIPWSAKYRRGIGN